VERVPRTATNAITAVTALSWIVAVLFAAPGQAAYLLGFVPARFSGLITIAPAVPAFLTPLTATLVHSGLIHLGFNLLIFVWCGTQVERVLGRTGLIMLYIVGAYASALTQWATAPASVVPMVGASGAISAVVGAFALSFGRARRITNNFHLNRWINVLCAIAAAGAATAAPRRSRRWAGLPAGDPGAHRRLRRGAAVAAPAAAMALPFGLRLRRG